MKHVFLVHSGITEFVAQAVGRQQRISREDSFFLWRQRFALRLIAREENLLNFKA